MKEEGGREQDKGQGGENKRRDKMSSTETEWEVW